MDVELKGAKSASGVSNQEGGYIVAISASETIGIGCIGVGGRGQSLLRNVLKVEGIEVRAVCDTLEKNTTEASGLVTKAGQKSPAVTADWQELLAMDGVDAVISALPVDLHKENYLNIIAAGKDLYAEKPMCLTVAECDEVVKAANASDVIVQIGFQRRADPRFIETMDLVHGGELGPLVEGRVAWSNAWGPLYGWFGQKERSGDWMVEQAVHNWDVLNWACQSLPVRAMGMGSGGYYQENQADRNVTDYYSAIVEYGNGVIVNILHSWVAPGQSGAFNAAFNQEYTRLIGTRAGIDFNSGTIAYRKELNLPDKKAFTFEGTIDNTLLCLEAFVNSVRTRTQPVATVEHGRDAVLACVLVREAVYKQGVVTMDELERAL